MMKHTEEPWEKDTTINIHILAVDHNGIAQNDEHSIAKTFGPDAEANAERIVACVNACEGISNEALEGGVIGEMKQLAYITKDRTLTQDETMTILLGLASDVLAKLEASDE